MPEAFFYHRGNIMRKIILTGFSFLMLVPQASLAQDAKALPTPAESPRDVTRPAEMQATPENILKTTPDTPAPTPVKKDVGKITGYSEGAPIGEMTLQHKLTPEAISKYYNARRIIHGRDFKDYVTFFDLYTSLEADITWSITTVMPDKKIKREKLEMTKDDLVAYLRAPYDEAQGGDISHKITALSISTDGKAAKAQDVTIMSNILYISSPTREKIKVNLQYQSTCNDEFVISLGGIPQIKKSICVIQKYFFTKPPRTR